MKILTIFTAIVLCVGLLPAKAQEALPKGFKEGSIILPDNSKLTGYIKDNMKQNASVVMMATGQSKKTTYDGDEINAAIIGDTKYICLKGDFFELLCEGEMSFLQKESDASSKPVQAGNQVMFINGTKGKPGDYFVYNSQSKELQHITPKNLNAISSKEFAGCEAAIAKAKESEKDIALLKEAVIIYNNRNSK